jgi:hypothetical protein
LRREQTEPNYFKSFRGPSLIIDVRGTGFNTLSLVKKTIQLRNAEEAKGTSFDQVWCVFDRDSFTPESFNAAIDLAKKENIEVAYSNEAFELWYILHFKFWQTALSRREYCKLLSKELGKPYEKNDPSIYRAIHDNFEMAYMYAVKLLEQHGTTPACNANPSTTVHKLVQILNDQETK